MSNTKESNRPNCPKRQLTTADRDCFKHPQLPAEPSISIKIEALLPDPTSLMTGKEYHFLFDAGGEQHTRRTAALDGQAGGLGSCRKGAAQVPARASSPFLYARNLRRDFNAALSR